MTRIDDKFRDEVAAAVRSLLGEQRRTVGELADALHIHRGTASERINGVSAFNADELPVVASFFLLPDVYALFDIAESIARRQAMAVAS